MIKPTPLPARYSIVENPSRAQLTEIFRLRVLAWQSQATIREGQVEWTDHYDDDAMHWAILFESHVVAAIRLSFHNSITHIPSGHCFIGVVPSDLEPPIASYNRLVVHPDHRGCGLAKALDILCINAAEAAGASILLGATGNLKENKSRIPAMEALGFEVLGIAAAPDVDIIADESLSTILGRFYKRPGTPSNGDKRG